MSGIDLTVARQMIGAEFVKLRRKRSLIVWSLLLTAGVIVVYFGVGELLHSSDPAKNSPPGGAAGLKHAMRGLGMLFGVLAAVLIGAEAGAGDRSSGVFRDLVVTGRSRLALFFVRVPGALMVCLPAMALAFALSLAGTFLLAGHQPTPSASTVVQYAGWLALVATVTCTFSVGVASLIGSRPAAITSLLGWLLVATPLIGSASALGDVRKMPFGTALEFVNPGVTSDTVSYSAAGVAVVIVAWLVVALALGAWRTRTQDA